MMVKKITAMLLAGVTALSIATTAPVAAAEDDPFASIGSFSSGVGLVTVGAIVGLFAMEGFSSALNAPYCGANPDKCPNSLTASLSSTASSEIDRARTRVPRVPTTVRF